MIWLEGVRRQLTEARQTLAESAQQSSADNYDPAYRAALRSRNLLFHATRGLAAARGEPMPEMPVVGIPGGGLADHVAALAALDVALAAETPEQVLEGIGAARLPYARYLGWVRLELGMRLRGEK